MTHNKLIVKNSVFMAIRMIVVMAIGLYTGRVVLEQLGVTDYGVFSVIGGLTVIMTFFNSALSMAIQRFMNVELGLRGQRDMQQVFSACWMCVVLITVCFLIIAEVIGLWFLNTKLSIPPDRLDDARIVFQISLLIATLEIMRVPYNSLIVAHERMSFYAYNSILEASLKLAAVISLSIIPGNKLLIYMGLLAFIAIAVNGSFVIYCKRYFPKLRFSLSGSGGRVMEIGKFAGWNLLTSISDIAYQQGSAMILNIFFGVALNATMGIANQVKTAVFSFTRSVQIAANPQIIKNFAAGDQSDFSALFMRISRISFFFVLFLGFPILLNTEFVLNLWLPVIPPMGVLFVRLMIVFCILDSLTGPLWITMQAAGQIARYQIVISLVWMLCLPLTWGVFKLGMPPYSMLLVSIGLNVTLLCVRLLFTSSYCGVKVKSYLKGVVARVVTVSVSAVVIPMFVFVCCDGNWDRLIFSSLVWCVTMPASVYLFGITRSERGVLISAVKNKLLKKEK